MVASPAGIVTSLVAHKANHATEPLQVQLMDRRLYFPLTVQEQKSIKLQKTLNSNHITKKAQEELLKFANGHIANFADGVLKLSNAKWTPSGQLKLTCAPKAATFTDIRDAKLAISVEGTTGELPAKAASSGNKKLFRQHDKHLMKKGGVRELIAKFNIRMSEGGLRSHFLKYCCLVLKSTFRGELASVKICGVPVLMGLQTFVMYERNRFGAKPKIGDLEEERAGIFMQFIVEMSLGGAVDHVAIMTPSPFAKKKEATAEDLMVFLSLCSEDSFSCEAGFATGPMESRKLKHFFPGVREGAWERAALQRRLADPKGTSGHRTSCGGYEAEGGQNFPREREGLGEDEGRALED
ncbi:hypothetical protein MBANPS3_012306 [Mucor bainieri]